MQKWFWFLFSQPYEVILPDMIQQAIHGVFMNAMISFKISAPLKEQPTEQGACCWYLKDWVLSALLSKGISLREKGNLELHSRPIKLNLKCIYGYNLHRSLGALTPCSWSQHKSDFNFNRCSSSVDSISKITQDWHYWFTGKFNKNGEA